MWSSSQQVTSHSYVSTALSFSAEQKCSGKYKTELGIWKLAYRDYTDDVGEAKRHDMAALAPLMQNQTAGFKTHLSAYFLADYIIAMSTGSSRAAFA